MKREFLGGTYFLKNLKINNFFVFEDIEKPFPPRDLA